MASTPASTDNDFFHFNYDVFISYKSEQDSWANRIARSLEDMGLRVWRDKDGGIRLGEEWRDEMDAGIRDSQSMLVMWSKLVHENSRSVVHDEIRKMKEFYEKDPRRRFFTVNLDGTPLHEILSPYHATYSFRKLYEKYGDDGADNAGVVEWYKALLELLRGLGIQNVVEVRFAVIAMTRSQAEQLNQAPEQYAHNTEAYELIKNAMELTSGFDLDRYGMSPDDWRPFAEFEDIYSVLDILRSYDDEKKRWTREQGEGYGKTKWLLVSKSEEILSDNIEERQAAIDSMLEGLSLVIVDPFSLMHKKTFDRVIQSGLHAHKNSIIISASPFVPQMHRDLIETVSRIEDVLEDVLEQAYIRFKKSFHPIKHACVMNIEHEYQFRRWLQVAADSIVEAKETLLRPHSAIDPKRRMEIRRQRRSPKHNVITMGQTH